MATRGNIGLYRSKDLYIGNPGKEEGGLPSAARVHYYKKKVLSSIPCRTTKFFAFAYVTIERRVTSERKRVSEVERVRQREKGVSEVERVESWY